jgi:hypothetical protein
MNLDHRSKSSGQKEMLMADDKEPLDLIPSDGRWVDEMEFRLIFVATFAIFVIGIFVLRLTPWRWGAHQRAKQKMSIIEEARETSSTITKLAFMG